MRMDLDLPEGWWGENYDNMPNKHISWLVSAIIFPNNPDALTDLMSKIRSRWDNRDL